MASEFLKRKVEEQAKRSDKEYNKATYGNISDIWEKAKETSKKSSFTKGDTEKRSNAQNITDKIKTEANKLEGKASNFLKQKVVEQSLVGKKQPYKASNHNIIPNATPVKLNYEEAEQKKTGEKILDSAGYIGEKLGKGVVDGLEGISDFGWSIPLALGWGVTSGFGMFDNPVENKIESWYNELNQNDITDTWGEAEKRYDAAPDKVKEWGWLPETVGNILPFVAETYLTAGASSSDDIARVGQSTWDKVTKFVTNPDVHFGMSAGGEATERAVDKGANPLTATNYGAIAGSVEVLTEKLFGGYAGTGIGKPVTKATKATTQATNKTLLKTIWDSPVTKKVLDFGAEGLEENIVTFVDPILQRTTGVDKNAEWATYSDYVESGTHGVILSVVMNAIGLPGYMIQKHDKSKAISSINEATEVLNGLIQDDTSKIQPLPTSATAEEIVARQKELQTVAIAFDNAVKKAVENEKQEQPIEGDTLEKAAMDVVANRNATQTTKTEPVSTIPNMDDSLPIQAEADVETINNETFAQDTKNMPLEDRIRQAKAKEGVSLETPTSINPNAKVGTVDQETIKSFGYGKTGTAAITDIVSKTNMAPEQARRRFQSAYEAGRLNLDRSKIDLIDGIQETAYIAGRQDAILEMDTLKNNEVSSWGKKSGIVKNEFSAKYDKKTYSTVNTIAKAMGTKVIVENIPQEMNSNGYYRSSDGTIHIDANLDDPVMTVVKHEITHRMKDLAPKEYMAYRDFAVGVMSDWGLGGKTTIEALQLDYRNQDNVDIDVTTAMDEIAADMTRAILSDEKALKRFIDHAKTSKANMNMANKFFQAVREFIDKVKATFSGNRQKMDEVTRDEFGLALEQLERAESLWKEAYRASETSAKKINEAKTTGTDTGIKKSLKKGDNRITRSVVKTIQSMDGKPVNDFTSDDIKKTEPFAKKYFEEMGVKSPFFRAWFGDWRANDKSPIHIVTEKGAKKGTTKNKDTNWSIQISGKVFNETKVQSSSKIKKAVPYLDYIEGIVENAVLLDTHTISREKAKSENSALMHSLYAVANNGNGQEILKLLVEELNDVNSDGTIFRSYQLQDVIKIPTASVRVQNNPSSLTNTVGNIDSVSDLFQFVKQNDKDFNPKPVSKVVNEDGTPMAVYHGTSKGGHTVFDAWGKGKFGLFGIGIYMTESREVAEGYTKKGNGTTPQVYELYANITNPLDMDKSADIKKWESQTSGEIDFSNCRTNEDCFRALKEYCEDEDMVRWEAEEYITDIIQGMGYDGITHIGGGRFNKQDTTRHRVWIAFDSTQVKSATDNIGTFDKNNPDIYHSRRREGQIMKDFRRMRAGEISPEEFEMRYDALVEQHGAISKGENPARDIEVPRKTADGKKVSQTARTILEAGVTPDEALPDIKAMVTSGVFSYDVYTDKKAIEDAEERINSKTWNKTLNKWFDDVKKGKVSKENTALGWALYNNAVNTAKESTSITEKETATNTALDILNAMVGHQRRAAQALQATRILKKLSPETQLYNAQKTVESLQQELKEKYGKDAPELKIDRELAQKFLEAETQEERDNIYKEIYRDIGRQMPSNWVDKFNALRYFAMLGNARTHIRNIVGNAAFAPIVNTKNTVATVIESTLRVATKGKFQGNKAILISTSKKDRALIKAAYNDYKNVADIISGNGKYNESVDANKYIEEGKKTFKSKVLQPLEKAIKGNSALLEIEDVWFSKPHYAYALAQYCKSHNITAEQIEKGIAILPARVYAIKEAQKATYKDTNAFSQTISGLGRARKDDNIFKKAVAVGVEGTLPFRRTPANILARGIEYSPIGIVKSLSYDLVQAKKGEITSADVVDNLSAGLTGTGLVALGVYLAAQGLIRGHGGDDEKEKEYEEIMGHQAYSLEIDDTSITLDWLAPEALPFFVGVNLWEMTKGKKENMDMATILTAIGNVSEPMLEMSCLQGINDLFDSIKFAESDGMDSLSAIAAGSVTSYFTQYVPTILGQFERTDQEERMATYVEKNKFLTKGMQRTLGNVSTKIIGWDFNQIPYIDAWGRKEVVESKFVRGLNNFLNPAYMSNIETSDMEKELLRLYKATGEGIVLPKRADSSFNIDGKEKVLTGKEYVRYATKKGQISYDMITELVNSDEYKNFTDAEKVEAIEKTYDYANQKAKNAVSNYNPEKWVNILDNVGVVNYSQYRRNLDEIDDNDSYSLSEKADALSSMDLNNDELAYLWDTEEGWEAYKKGIRMSKYIDFKDAASGFKADKDKNGKTISGSKKEKVVKYLNKSKLSDKEWDYFYYELMGYKE